MRISPNAVAFLGIILAAAGYLTEIYKWYFVISGAALLFGALIFELWSSRPKKRIQASEEWKSLGSILVTSGKLLISDGGQSRFKMNRISLNLGQSCELQVQLLVAIDQNGAVNKLLSLTTDGNSGRIPNQKHQVLIETAVLAMLDESFISPSDKSLDALFKSQGIYRALEQNSSTSVAVLIMDETERARGIVVQAGLGDGDYEVNVETQNGTAVISCDFLAEE